MIAPAAHRRPPCHGRARARRARRGVALVAVLWLVVLLGAVSAATSRAARASAVVAANHRAEATARPMAESGIVAARARLEGLLAAAGADPAAREAAWAWLDRADGVPLVADTLGDGAFAVAASEVSARLDVNGASAEALARLFARSVGPTVARRLAARIVEAVEGRRADDAPAGAGAVPDALRRALLGDSATPPVRRPLRSLDELADVPGVAEALPDAALALLTVDGDGRVNRRRAPVAVLDAAEGTLVDEPTRILLIARGWRLGHPLTVEIQAVYDIAPDGLHLVRWRERTL